MKLVPDCTHKAARDLVAGELGLISFGGDSRYLCFRLGDERDPHLELALVRLGQPENGVEARDPPMVTHLQLRDRPSCLSFGTDWVLEYEFDKLSIANNRQPYGQPGVLFIASEGPVLCLDNRDRHRFADFVFVNLGASAIVELPENAWPTETWRIWATQADQANVRGRPLYEHVPYRAVP